jgi:hypothetical protein
VEPILSGEPVPNSCSGTGNVEGLLNGQLHCSAPSVAMWGSLRNRSLLCSHIERPKMEVFREAETRTTS